MTTTSRRAAPFFSGGKGMLILDDYASEVMTAPAWPGLSFERYVRMVMTSRYLPEHLSGIVVSCDTVFDGAPRSPNINRGVRMPLKDRLTPGELQAKLTALSAHGVTLTEWRANLPVAQISKGQVHTDASALVEGAAASLVARMTPILTIAMPDLESHSQGVTHAATANALTSLSAALDRAGIDLGAVLLRVNMIIPGRSHALRPTPEEVAGHTLRVLDETLDPALGGIVLLSGGQLIGEACDNLSAITALARAGSVPWPITFAFTRALVNASLDVAAIRDEGAVHQALTDACRRAAEAVSGTAALSAP